MKRYIFLLLLLIISPSFLLAGALPLSELMNAADDYWRTSTPQRPVLIQGGQINSAQQYIPIPLSATPALVGFAMGAGSLGGLAFYQQTGKDPVMAILDGVHHVFKPAFLAFQENFVSPESFPAAAAQFVGVEASIGASLSDIVSHAKDSALGLYTTFKNLMVPVTEVPILPLGSFPAPGSTFVDENGNTQILSAGKWARIGSGGTYQAPPSPPVSDVLWKDPTYLPSYSYAVANSNTGAYYYTSGGYELRCWFVYYDSRSHGYNMELFKLNYTFQPDLTPSLNPEGGLDLPALALALEDAIANNPDPAIKQELAEIIIHLPSTQVQIATAVPAASVAANSLDHPSISPQLLEQFFAQNAAQVANQALEIANNPVSTPEQVAAAQIAAQAAQSTAQQAESQMEPEPENYADIPLSGFSDPYNPGPFDIPDRFDTFLANVAGTGLFSFPSQYFNSLPGGGTPTYTIEAGTYGTHTVDLSETMGTGLAVLKTVLLLCFAFLSVRVVVLKR